MKTRSQHPGGFGLFRRLRWSLFPTRRAESGQMLVVVVFIVVVMVISISLVVFINQVQGKFSVASQKRDKATSATQQGLSYAIHTLSATPATWSQALNAQFPAEFFDATTSSGLHLYDLGLSGIYFTIACSTGAPNTANYQVSVLITSYVQDQGQLLPTRALSAVLSQKTASVTLPTNVTASAALELFTAPSAANFVVHWGPIAVFDSVNNWQVNSALDAPRFPRKFAQSGISGATYPRSQANPPINSDGQEYWAYSSLGYVPGIDLGSYQALAQATPLAIPPTSALTPGVPLTPSNCIPALSPPTTPVPQCADFELPSTDTAVFDGAGAGYTVNQPGGILFVNGNAELDNAAIDLKGSGTAPNYNVFPSTGALIVAGSPTTGTGYLTIGGTHGTPIAPTAGLPGSTIMHMPNGAALDYPYSQTSFPCSGSAGGCTVATAFTGAPNANQNLNFRGFIYVQGNLSVTSNTPFLVDGAVRVDNTMTTPGASISVPPLWIFHDDEINHSILVDHLELQVDSQQPVVAH
jgi:hypothetical protein